MTADEAYLRDCIFLPDKHRVAGFPPLMPNFSGTVGEGQVVALIAYIKSLTTDRERGAQNQSPGGRNDRRHVAIRAAARCRRGSYLDEGHTISSWLTTTDHKRIAILYALSITVFFFIGGVAIGLVRLELISPTGLFLTSDEYNRLFTIHGIIMVWFFLVPSIPATMGNFLLPMMIGAPDVAFPRLNLMSWYLYVGGAAFTVYVLLSGGVDTGWTFYPPFSSEYSHSNVIAGGRRRVHRRLFLDRDRRQFPRHHPYAACAGHDVVSAAAVRLVDVCDQHGDGAGDAGARHVAAADVGGTLFRLADLRSRPPAAIRCCSSICSGSTAIRPSTS